MRKTIFIIFLLYTSFSWSQKYKFGKVSKEELQEEYSPIDSTANAAILYSERKSRFDYSSDKGFFIVEEYFTRIKIYNKEGFDYATKEIEAYHNQGSRETISSIKGKTYTLVKGSIEKTKLDKKNIFKEKKSKYRDVYKFTMPNIKPGSIIEYKYTKRTPFKSQFDEVRLQEDIPIKKIFVRISIPEYYTYNQYKKGFLTIPIKKETKERTINYNYETSGNVHSPTKHVARRGTSNFSFTEYLFTINKSNVLPLKDEVLSGNIDDYKSGISFELAFRKRFNGVMDSYSSNWESIAENIYFSSSFGEQLKKKNHFKEDLQTLLIGETDDSKKIIKIYQFVKDKIKWNGYNGYFTDEGVRKAYKKGEGNIADINLNLVAMLKYAGLKADPVLVSTIKNGIPIYPTLNGFNYVIAYVSTPQGYLLLDATRKNALPNILPRKVLNFRGRLINEDAKSSWVDLFPTKHSLSNTIIKVKFNDTGFKGTARKTITNNLLLSYRDNLRGKSKEDVLKWIDDTYDGIDVINARVSNLDKLDKNGIETIQFETESFYEDLSGKTYISPLLYKQMTENIFKSEKREFPIFYNYPRAYINEININIPENYSIETMPENNTYPLPDNTGGYSFEISKNGQNIKILSKLVINKAVISPVYYNDIKEFFNSIITKQAERIVLVKK